MLWCHCIRLTLVGLVWGLWQVTLVQIYGTPGWWAIPGDWLWERGCLGAVQLLNNTYTARDDTSMRGVASRVSPSFRQVLEGWKKPSLLLRVWPSRILRRMLTLLLLAGIVASCSVIIAHASGMVWPDWRFLKLTEVVSWCDRGAHIMLFTVSTQALSLLYPLYPLQRRCHVADLGQRGSNDSDVCCFIVCPECRWSLRWPWLSTRDREGSGCA